MNLGNDIPITAFDSDEYGWVPYAQKVAGVIADVDSEGGSFVVALQGPWGSGKTSFLNLVENGLSESVKSGKVGIARFNPWLFQNENDLLNSFFRLICSETSLGVKGKAGSIAEKLRKYVLAVVGSNGSDIVNAALAALSISNPAIGLAANVLDPLANRALAESDALDHESLSGLKSEIDDELRKQNRKLVVFMDDLDRLSSEEVRLIFKTVALTASFPKIVYVLAFDRDVVVKALSDVQNLEGESYLEKIVQLPIDLPPVGRAAAQSKVDSWVEELYLGSTFSLGESDRYRLYTVSQGLLIPCLKTPRRFSRFENALAVKRLMVGDEICPVDLIGLLSVQVYFPKVFDWVKENITFLCGEEILAASKVKDIIEAKRDELGRLLKSEYHLGDGAFEALRTLFPPLDERGQHYDGRRNPRSKKSAGRICSLELFKLFQGYEALTGLNHSERVLVLESADGKHLSELFDREFAQGDINSILSMLEDNVYSIREERVYLLAQTLTGFLVKHGGEQLGFTRLLTFENYFGYLMLRFGQRFGSERLTSLFVEKAKEAKKTELKGLANVLWIEVSCRSDRNGDGYGAWMSDAGFADFAHWYIGCVQSSVDDILASGSYAELGAWRAADQMLHLETFEAFLGGLSSDFKSKVLYFSCRLNDVSDGSQGYRLSNDEADPEYPTVSEVDALLGSEAFLALSHEAQLRVAALRALLNHGEDRGSFSNIATREDALELVNRSLIALGSDPIE